MATPVKTVQGWIDNSNERTRSTLYFPRPDGATIVGITDMEANMNTVRLTMDTLTLLNEVNLEYALVAHSATPSLPASKWAQRENGLRFIYSDTVTSKLYRLDLPGVDRATYGVTGTDTADLAQTDIAAFVTAFEAQCISPAGNPVTMVSARFYGKNN